MIPLLFHLELRTGGDYLSQTMRELPPSDDTTAGLMAIAMIGLSGLGAHAVAGAAAGGTSPAGAVELFLTGPRWVIGGWRHLRQASKLSSVDVKLAAAIVALLLRRSQGMEAKELRATGRPMQDV